MPLDTDERQRQRSYLLWLLGRRDYSRHQLRQKLKRRGLERDIADELIDELAAQSFFREENYTHVRIKTLIRRGLGRRAVESKLRGEFCPFTDSDIEKAYEELGMAKGDDLRESATRLWEKLHSGSRLDEHKIKARFIGQLQRKGYPLSEIFQNYNALCAGKRSRNRA